MTAGDRFSPERPCRLCGGTRGAGSEGAHELCKAREALQLPTPSLGHACATCGGRGFVDRAGDLAAGLGAAFFLDGSGDLERYLRERWPRCAACGGSGNAPEVSP
jgi:hypothetical protein